MLGATALLVVTSLALASAASRSAAPLSGADRWIHVRVEQTGERPESVRVNVPLSLVEKVAPLVQEEGLRHGKVRLGFSELGSVDLRAAWKALKETGDAEFVTVEGADGTVRVAREGDYLVVRVADSKEKSKGNGEQGARVDARLPLDVVDALLSGSPDELDVLAGVRALAAHEGDLITVKDRESVVHVWIDGQNRNQRDE